MATRELEYNAAVDYVEIEQVIGIRLAPCSPDSTTTSIANFKFMEDLMSLV